MSSASRDGVADGKRISGRQKERASDDTDVLERVNKCDYIRFGKGVH